MNGEELSVIEEHLKHFLSLKGQLLKDFNALQKESSSSVISDEQERLGTRIFESIR